MSAEQVISIANTTLEQLEHAWKELHNANLTEVRKQELITHCKDVLALWNAVNTDVSLSDNPVLVQTVSKITDRQAELSKQFGL